MRSAARLSSTSWNPPTTVCLYAETVASYAARASSVWARRRPPSNTVSEIVGPTDQTRLGHVNHCATLLLSKPPDAPSVTLGKNAAMATPIWAFAAATRRSAPATSGRRWRSSDGTPTGMVVGVAASGACGREELQG